MSICNQSHIDRLREKGMVRVAKDWKPRTNKTDFGKVIGSVKASLLINRTEI
ncbi:MAG: hypothetical protein ABIR81_11045 [Ginsengibacter sp.]